jgi:hypothetical protein
MPGNDLMQRPAAEDRVTLEVLGSVADVHTELIKQFVGYGLIEPVSIDNDVVWFDARHRAAARDSTTPP